jgi:hypothetical protein
MVPTSVKVAYGVSIAGLFTGAAYYVVRAYTSQSFDGDSEILIAVGAIFWFPVSIGILAPAWLILPRLAQPSSAAKHWT